jgi:hypothetical protein
MGECAIGRKENRDTWGNGDDEEYYSQDRKG